jgi:transcriptional regulator NrdR family protein
MQSSTMPECPNCGTFNSEVQNTKPTPDGGRVRRRICRDCKAAWYTQQRPEEYLHMDQLCWNRNFISVVRPRHT